MTAWDQVGFTDVYYQTRNSNDSDNEPDSGIVPGGRPIPGAYNRFLDTELPNLTVTPYGALDFAGDHSYVWSDFYLATVRGTNDPLSRPAMQAVDYRTTGYAFSSVASGSDPRPAQPRPTGTERFNFLAADQDNRYGSPIPLNLQSTIATKQYQPRWSPLTIVNGGFDYIGDSETLLGESQVPGWTAHGGSGTGNVVQETGLQFLELNFGDSTRTHNDVYVPKFATHLSYLLRRTETSTDDLFQVFIGNELVDQVSLESTDAKFMSRRVLIPEKLQNSTQPIRFFIQSPGILSVVDSEVQIDDIQFATSTSGKTGDVIPVNLKPTSPPNAAFGLTGNAELYQFGADPKSFPLQMVRNTIRGDWELSYTETTAPFVRHVLGTIIDSDRVNGTPFSSSGSFYFVPGTENNSFLRTAGFDTSNSTGFQGTVVVQVSTNGVVNDLVINISEGGVRHGSQCRNKPIGSSQQCKTATTSELSWLSRYHG